MNWSSISFDWNQVRAFLVTAEEGTFSAAARALNLTQPTLSRQVAALEQALGVLLFERVGRSLHLTAPGQDLLEHVRDMGLAAARVSLAASGQSQTVEGHVSITASDSMSAYILPPIIRDLRAREPGLTIDIIAANDIRDLQRREADIAIRHVRPDQPDLITKRVRGMQAYLYAATSYLDRMGRPKTTADLMLHEFIGFTPLDRFVEELAKRDLPVSAQNVRVMTENGIVSWELTKQGLGIAPMITSVAEQSPELERVLPDGPPIEVPVWLTTHQELKTSRRIRVVFDLLAERL